MSRRKRTINLFEADAARAVNSQMARTNRSRSQPLPKTLLNADMQATEPRQIRKVMAQDLKDARWRTFESAPSEQEGKKMFNDQYREERHTACGSKKKAIRFLTEGSRDIESNELPKCYMDPKGLALSNKNKSIACPCGGSYTPHTKAKHLRTKKHTRAHVP